MLRTLTTQSDGLSVLMRLKTCGRGRPAAAATQCRGPGAAEAGSQCLLSACTPPEHASWTDADFTETWQ